MKKLLRYFPLSKKIQKKDAKSLLITVGIYLAVLFAFFIVKKILVPVKIIGTLVYNLSKLYNTMTSRNSRSWGISKTNNV